jgi:hypothetical protein
MSILGSKGIYEFHMIGTREVEIMSDCDIEEEVLDQFRKKILLVCETYKFASYFPLLTFYLKKGPYRNKQQMMYVSGTHSIKEPVIYVCFENIIKQSSMKEVVVGIRHEIAHLRQEQLTNLSVINQKVGLRIVKLKEKFEKELEKIKGRTQV